LQDLPLINFREKALVAGPPKTAAGPSAALADGILKEEQM
jgi:hypothetical protein